MNSEELQHFLNQYQYTDNSILRYEWIFGRGKPGFLSPGGSDSADTLLEGLKVQEGARFVDVGCGIGGIDVYIADKFKSTVHGIDLADNCIKVALERYGSHPNVEFEIADCLKVEIPDNSVDVIYSRDAILHIAEKSVLFEKFFKWLKPGGKVIITDYCAATEQSEWTPEFAAYVKQRGYTLCTVSQYASLLSSAGLTIDIAENTTQWFVDILKQELAYLEHTKEDFLKVFSQQDYDDLKSGWEAKIVRCGEGCQAWGRFEATKPL